MTEIPTPMDAPCHRPGCHHPIYEHRLLPQPEEFNSFSECMDYYRTHKPGCALCVCREEHRDWEPDGRVELEHGQRVSDLEREDEWMREA